MNALELAWAAGMFEGEGSIRINKPTKRNRGALLCDMVNTAPEVCAFFAERWGGYLKRVEVPPPRKAFWRWRIAAREAARFLRAIQPYLRTDKYRRRAQLALDFQEQKRLGGRSNRTATYLAAQDAFYEEMRDLNVRGVPLDGSRPAARVLVHVPVERLALFDLDDCPDASAHRRRRTG